MDKVDKTVFDPGATVAEGGTTLFDSGGIPSIPDAAPIDRGMTLLDTYRVESDAIEGGMGSVWRVHHTGWNVDLAMKRPQPKCFCTEKSKADFIHECEAWINLGLHPNIVSCYYVREISGTPTIFSEWMDGGSLEGAIARGSLYQGTKAEQKARILDIAIQFARGLHYAHEAGLIHQDVKPDNVLLTKEGEAKVADFGLARARAVLTVLEGDPTLHEPADSGKTMLSPSGGYTPAYCSMEQMDGRELTRRTDIYSWAVSVMEMYTGCRPWANGVVAGLSCRNYFEQTRVSMPEALKELLAQCLDGEPENRPHDFAEIESKLHGIYQAETGTDYPRPVPKAAADTADSLNNRALSFLDLGKPDEAERAWARALTADPKHIFSAYNQALLLWRKGKLTDAGALKAFRHVSAGNADDAAKYAQALLHMERGAGNDALQLLDSCSTGDKDIAEAIAQTRQIGHPMLAYTLKGTLFRRYRYPERDAHVHCIAFSKCGNYVYARDYADVVEEEPDRGHINFWRLSGAGGVALGGLDPEIQKVRWQEKKSYGPPVESNGLNYMIALYALHDGGKDGEWYVQNSEGRILYTNFREVTGRPYGCLDINVDHTLVACGSHDSNDVDIFQVPKLSYVAPWLLCKVRSQRELSAQDDRFMELSKEVNRKLSIKEPAQALACLREMQPLVNAANQSEYRCLNAELGRFCKPTFLRAIYPDPIYPSAPEAQFGFHAEYKSVFVDRQQGKFLWEDSRRKKSNTPAAVSPDQALLVYAVYEGNHWLLIAANPLSGAERNTLKLTETPGDICFFPDGQSFLVALCETISVMKINAKTFKIEKSFSGRKSRLTEKVFVRINHAGTHFVYGRLGDSHAGKGVDHEALTFCSVRDNNVFHTKDGLIGFEDYISDALFSEYDRWLLTKHFDHTVRIWETAAGRCIQRFAEPETLRTIVSEGRMDWDYDFPGFTDWDESARPYLEIFLALHSDWTEANFQNLILNLQTRGYGWLRPEGVRAKLMEMKPKDGNPRTEKTKFSLFGKKQS